MISKINFLLICLIIFLIQFNKVFNQKPLECNPKSDIITDRLFAELITFGNSGIKFPEKNDNKIIGYFCRSHSERLKVLETYVKKCKTGLTKQLISVFVYTIKNQIKQLCRKDSIRRQNIMNAGKCINAARVEFEKCNINITEHLMGIKLGEDKLKIPLTCCEYHNYKNCFRERGQLISICNDKHLDTITDFIDSMATNALSILCGEYSDGSDKCEKLPPPPKRDPNERKPKSFFLPFLSIFESFAEV